jgi:hypothetical protein
MSDLIVCGWYTPDYSVWADKLTANLSDLGLPHDFVQVEKPRGGWEKTTMLKAGEVLDAMDRHPGKVVIFLDVDCEVRSADKLRDLATIPGDVGFYLRTKWRRGGGTRIGTRSGTMVFKPTAAARRFVEVWRDQSEAAPKYSVDQDSLAVAMGKVQECVLSFLDVRYCAVATDKLADAWVLHASASESAWKAKKIQKFINRLLTSRRGRVPVPVLA